MKNTSNFITQTTGENKLGIPVGVNKQGQVIYGMRDMDQYTQEQIERCHRVSAELERIFAKKNPNLISEGLISLYKREPEAFLSCDWLCEHIKDKAFLAKMRDELAAIVAAKNAEAQNGNNSRQQKGV